MRKILVVLLGWFCFSYGFANEIKRYDFHSQLDSARAYENNNDYKNALRWAHKALVTAKRQHNKQGMMNASFTLGRVYYYDVNYGKSMKYHTATLALAEALKNEKMQADCINAIGCIYYARLEFDDALRYFKKSFALSKKEPNSSLHASNLSYMAGIMYNKNQFDSAGAYYVECEKIYTELRDSSNMIMSRQNGASVFHKLGQSQKAIKMLEESIVICKLMHSPQDIGYGYFLMALIYEDLKDSKNAARCFKNALDEATKVNDYVFMSNDHLGLSNALYSMGDYKNALEHYRKHVIFKDSAFNEEQLREITSREVTSKLERKQLADSLSRVEKEREETIRRNESEKRQQIYTMSGIIGFGLMCILAFVLYRSNRHKQKTNLLITEQKKQVEEQKARVEEQKYMLETRNKEVFDSINYAKRLQRAIMATPEEIREYLPKSFLHYQPKDIVAGDFYFFEVTNSHLFIAAADCTGHGVPGAMVSVVCANALSRCVKEFGLTDPGKILDKTSELVLETFRKSGEIKDGMDIALISLKFNVQSSKLENNFEPGTLNLEPAQLQFSGANNPLWIYDAASDEIIEKPGDKRPVGLYDNPKPFTTHTVTLKPNDMIYLFTDGYADQFGGEKGKKMKSGNLKKYLYHIRFKPMDEQRRYLAETFEQWRGNLEQIDDVCLIGIRI